MPVFTFPDHADSIEAAAWRDLLRMLSPANFVSSVSSRVTPPTLAVTGARGSEIVTLGPFHGIVDGVHIHNVAASSASVAGRVPSGAARELVLDPASERTDKMDIRESAATGIALATLRADAQGLITLDYQYPTARPNIRAGSQIEAALAALVLATGAAVTGPVVLPGAPTAPAHAVPKSYVDAVTT